MIIELEEDGVKIVLTVVDTPGFGDSINNEAQYIKSLNFIVSMKSCLTWSINMMIF